MLHFPYTHVLLGDEKALAVTGHHFHVLNAHTGEIIHTTTRLDDDSRDQLSKSGPIRCAAADATFTHVITTGDQKRLKVWAVGDELKLLSERELPKKPTQIGFTSDGLTIVVSDKFGDVFSYPLHPEPTPAPSTSQTGASKRSSLTSHENPSNGTLILGHASMLTTYLLTPDEQYILTADRDEHIRVSWFPKGYVIERYCLGHEKFVSALHIPSFAPSILVSGGGDPVLKTWDWLSGKRLAEVSIFEAVEPYIKVKAPKWRRAWNDGEGDGEEGPAAGKNKGKGKGRRRGKGKKDGDEAREESAEAEPHGDRQPTQEPTESSADVAMSDAAASVAQDPPKDEDAFQLVFAIQRIQSVDRSEHGRFILFSAIGATAVFYAPFPAEGDRLPASTVRAVDLGKPVIDFTVDQSGNVLAFLDTQWGSAPDAESAVDTPSVRLLSWRDGTLAESSAGGTPLLTALNTKCLVQATAAELKALDLYGALSSLPKNVDPEHDPLIRDTLSEVAAASTAGDAEGKQLTQRELGRLKKKKALLAKIQEQQQQKGGSREGTAEAEAEREVKRARSESASVEGASVPAESTANVASAGDIADAGARDVDMDAS